MSRYAYHLAGKSYDRIGTVKDSPPNVAMCGWYVNKKGQTHGRDRMAERGMTQQDIEAVLADPIVVFDQAGGTSLGFLSERGFVATTSSGEVKTVYGADYFDDAIRAILREAGFQ